MKDRITALMKQEKMDNKQMGERVGASKEAIYAYATGRREPTYGILQKILLAFPKLNSDWLLLGKGSMYRQEMYSQQPSLFNFESENQDVEEVLGEPEAPKIVPENPIKEIKTENIAPKTEIPPAVESKVVKKFMVFYSDATYEEFNK